MSINKRIKDVRKQHKLSQVDFGKVIGLKKSGANQIEQEGYNVSAQSIQLICNNFHVSEEWLVNGTGEPYVEDADSILTQLTKEFRLSPSTEALVKMLCEMPQDTQDSIVKYIELAAVRMQEARKKAEEAKKAKAGNIPHPDNITDEEWSIMLMALEAERREKGTRNIEVSSSTSLKSSKN